MSWVVAAAKTHLLENKYSAHKQLFSADCSIQVPSLVDAATHIQGVASLLSSQILTEVCFTSFLSVSQSVWTFKSTSYHEQVMMYPAKAYISAHHVCDMDTGSLPGPLSLKLSPIPGDKRSLRSYSKQSLLE